SPSLHDALPICSQLIYNGMIHRPYVNRISGMEQFFVNAKRELIDITGSQTDDFNRITHGFSLLSATALSNVKTPIRLILFLKKHQGEEAIKYTPLHRLPQPKA